MTDRIKIALERLVHSTTHIQAPKEYCDDILVIRNAITELEADKVRLDWLDNARYGADPVFQAYRDKTDVDFFGWRIGYRGVDPTLRAAIDTAMREEREKQKV